MADASFKDVPEIFEVRARIFQPSEQCRNLTAYAQVELGEALAARTESLCWSLSPPVSPPRN